MGEGVEHAQAALGVLPEQVADDGLTKAGAGAQESRHCHVISFLVLRHRVQHLAKPLCARQIRPDDLSILCIQFRSSMQERAPHQRDTGHATKGDVICSRSGMCNCVRPLKICVSPEILPGRRSFQLLQPCKPVCVRTDNGNKTLSQPLHNNTAELQASQSTERHIKS